LSSDPDYAELHCLSNFTFLRGASHPQELVERAAALGYAALALTDECSLAGVVRAHVAARAAGLRLVVGSEVRLEGGPLLVILATDREGYGNLAALVTRGRREAVKGHYRLTGEDLAGGLPGCLVLWIPAAEASDAATGRWLGECFPGRVWVTAELLRGPDDRGKLARLERLARSAGLPLVAAGDVHMHVRSRRALQDTLTAVRLGRPLAEAGYALYPNGERHLRPRAVLARLYPPDLLEQTLVIAERCRFSPGSLRYEYPEELVPPAETPAGYLRRLTEEGMRRRWPAGAPARVRALVEHELGLVTELAYEPYFLTVHDLVRFARGRGILCQGRGSAANSAVCYCLGITEVDPARTEMLFERFISRERNEPPDIDVDFEHERREEVIQYLYAKYGRERAALAASVITYRPRSAVRDVGKALGLAPEQVDRLAKSLFWWDGRRVGGERLADAGLDPDGPVLGRLRRLVNELVGFPRHLSQHVGGFVISRGPLSRLVPIENAAMAGRTVIQWDKDDLDALGLLKVDVLALGMLTAIRRAFELVNGYRAPADPLGLHNVPAEDPEVYAMIRRADTMGVFQIESRAQMAMLPRLRPATFYDLVIEVAIVRPGPIQGGMVHPYLRRRQGLEPVTYPSQEVRGVLERTLGVPIFQEQVMKLAVVAAGFTPGEADQIRRSMAAWRRKGGLEPFRERLVAGMHARGYSEAFAERIFQQIQGFGEYGFPESHAASFALLVYVSAWLKRYEPAAFMAALLNSQPMGFYAPAQLVQDARRHGVEVRAVDVTASAWDCTLEAGDPMGSDAVDLGAREEVPAAYVTAGPGHGFAGPCAARTAAHEPPGMDSRRVPRGRARDPRDRAISSPALGPARPGASLTEPGRGGVVRDEDGGTVCRQGEAADGRCPAPAKPQPAVRLGLRMVKGLSRAGAERLVRARAEARFRDLADLAHRAGLARGDLECVAAAGALARLAGDRHQARWAVLGVAEPPALLAGAPVAEERPELPVPSEAEDLLADYAGLGLSLGRHPLALLRAQLRRRRLACAADVAVRAHGERVRTAGLVVNRQRPGTASGVTFVTLEDETGHVNLVVWARVAERQRRELLGSRLLAVSGTVEREGEVVHVVARRLEDLSALIGALRAPSRDFQ
jgi:error-prone DNA polymerase